MRSALALIGPKKSKAYTTHKKKARTGMPQRLELRMKTETHTHITYPKARKGTPPKAQKLRSANIVQRNTPARSTQPTPGPETQAEVSQEKSGSFRIRRPPPCPVLDAHGLLLHNRPIRLLPPGGPHHELANLRSRLESFPSIPDARLSRTRFGGTSEERRACIVPQGSTR